MRAGGDGEMAVEGEDMKQAYSDFVYSKIAREMSHMGFKAAIEMAVKYSRHAYEFLNLDDSQYYSNDIEKNIKFTTEVLLLEGNILRGHATHLFCKKTLFDWLISRAKDIEINPQWVDALFKVDGEGRYTPIVLHVSGGGSPSCVYGVEKSSRVIVLANNSHSMAQAYCISQNTQADRLEFQTDVGKKILSCSMFIKGLSMYSKCCSNVIIEGVPDDLKHAPRFNSLSSRTIATHSDIVSEDHSAISPHFRNGCFHLLLSDKFTKKKGQIIFVRECFVKGQAKTVVDKEGKDNP